MEKGRRKEMGCMEEEERIGREEREQRGRGGEREREGGGKMVPYP
jgi:hypothetical protein